jgi:hypothetical protein
MIDISLQLSLGRFPLTLSEETTVRETKKKLRTVFVRQLLQVNINAFRLNVGGRYLSDESQKLKDAGVKDGDVLFFVKKSAAAAAALDTEVPVDD